ncbi:MAG: hypothetical protein RJA22_63 [Verrucomicrobiota bacterium]|jgi:ABC-type Fe3+-hydroxamate transport system substrate-binding protein
MIRPRFPLLLILAVLAAGWLTGCARYKVVFTNQTTTTSRGKPRFNKEAGTITFKDGRGVKQTVPAFSVETIEPY